MSAHRPSVGVAGVEHDMVPLSSSIVAFLIMWHTSTNYLAYKAGVAGSLFSGFPDHQILSSRFDDLHRQGLETVDR
jgi:hypothetical protein